MNENNWLSLHVFLSDPEKSLRFLNEWLAPQVQRLVNSNSLDRWFFIRYWDGGPHLRLRFKINKPYQSDALQNALQEVIVDYSADKAITREQYYGAHSFDGETLNIETLDWYGEGAVVPISYEPEITRYGGDQAILVNEQLFQVSSDIVLRICREPNTNVQQHLMRAMSLMAATFFGYSCDSNSGFDFFDGYASYWRTYSEAAAEAELSAGKEANAGIVRTVGELLHSINDRDSKQTLETIWSASIRDAITEFESIWKNGELVSPLTGAPVETEDDFHTAVQLMLSSQVHMMNNRLGVIPTQECYLARLLANAVQGV
ncbi:thiopeptide-type bacteriocin biosynthesis protein [Teredinibacter waterburyi]|jgi:hypothetical protein|uniref:thiopeptide-type bacteriocin biosynthesis protein n=1 Tax=Teredinibacter waterburyi TaxID=1500538 RepID=UPI00165F14A0|nr:thiopeptide-type bacteriocin biosynthesis protein [Teredinibacter waterburyi]